MDERYYESVPFKVTILPKTIELKPNKQFKYFGEEDPVLENDDYILRLYKNSWGLDLL